MPSIANAASLNRAAELRRLRAAAAVVNAVIPPTPQYCWPLLSQALGLPCGSSTRTIRKWAPSRCAAG